MQSLYEHMGETYRQEGDYFVPNLELPETGTYQLGKYGHMRRRYLQEHHPAIYNTLLLSGKLFEHLSEIDQICHARMERLCTAMAIQEDVIETLKAADQLEWVRRMNSVHNRAEEIVCTELVYTEDGRA